MTLSKRNFQNNYQDFTLERCPECGSPLVFCENELVCKNCGLVVFTNSVDMSRSLPHFSSLDAPNFLSHLGSCMDLHASEDPHLYHLNRIGATWLRVGKISRNLYYLSFLHRLGDHLNVSKSTLNLAVSLFLNVISRKKIRRKEMYYALAAYSIVLASRIISKNLPLPLSHVLTVSKSLGYEVRGRDILRASSLFQELMKPTYPSSEGFIYLILMKLSTQIDFSLLQKMGFKEKSSFIKAVAEESLQLLSVLRKYRGGRNPSIFSGAIIYAALKVLYRDKRPPISQRKIAECIGVAEYSIREVFEGIWRLLTELEVHKP
ncbi:MAG TPA: hypothetical protein ENF41_05050 [Candidatus Bathyarchaeota archaeon]|nr:hypothetical protein [Candidatus Bathyarchaeota archaeon]